MLPNAKRSELLVQDLGRELVVYNTRTHKTHCLGEAAAAVWRHCDGQNGIADLAGHLRNKVSDADEEVVWLILHRLSRLGLLESPVSVPEGTIQTSRREMTKKVLALGGIGALFATTMIAPTAAQASSLIVNCGECA